MFSYDFEKLKELSKVVTRNLNKIIDVNHYPVEEARTSNMRHRCRHPPTLLMVGRAAAHATADGS